MSDINYALFNGYATPDFHWDPIGSETSFFWDEPENIEVKTEPFPDGLCGGQIEDLSLLDLAKNAEETGDLMPLIKEELKCKIQAKRHASGQPEIELTEEKTEICQLTDDDIRKRENRRAQNRRAAKKYRNKQRDILSADKQEKNRLEQENEALTMQLSQLRQDVQSLLTQLHLHQAECQCREAVVPDWNILSP